MANTAEQTVEAPLPPDGTARKKRRPTGGFECKLGLLVGIGGLIGSRLGHLWIAFDVFSQFTLQFAVIALGFGLGALMPRAKLLVAFVTLLLGLIAIGVWPHVATSAATPLATAGSGERPLRIASFNTLYVNENADAVAAEVRRLDADLIVLLEMGNGKRRILGELADLYPHQSHCYQIDYCNLVVLSKIPILESDAKAIWDGPPYIRVRLGEEAGGLWVVGVHTIRFPHSRAQFRQANVLGQMVEAMPGRKIVMGDFNATPFSRILQTVETRGSLTRLTSLPSWPSHLGLPQIAIDHILASPGIRVLVDEAIGSPAGSDHFPVSMTLAIPLAP